MTLEKFIEEIQKDVEWLETTEGYEVECISIENLEGILTRMTGSRVIISEHECLPNLNNNGNEIK